MKAVPPGLDDSQRQAALQALRGLDASPDAELDRITRLAARLFGVPVALVSLAGDAGRGCRSRVGPDAAGIDGALAFCEQALAAPGLLLVEDARHDPRFRDAPAVRGAPHIVFFAGKALQSRAGRAVGSLCLIGHAPRRFSAADAAQFDDLVAMAQAHLQRLELAQHAQALGQDSLRMEYALREAERRYLALFNNRTHGIMHMRMVCDARGQVTNYVIEAVNAAYERLMGRAREDLEGRLVTEVFPGIERMPGFNFLDPYARVAMGGEEARFDRFFPPLGRWYNVYAYSPAHGECISIFTDITTQKQMEAELRARDEMLRSTFEQAAIGIAHVSAEGRFLRVNRCLCDMLGYREEELAGKHFNDITPVADQAASRAVFDRTVAGELATFTLEKRYRRKDGELIWARISASCVRDPAGGQPLHNLVMVEDITARKQVEESLRRERAQLQAILDHAPELISIKDAEGRLLLVNNAVLEQMQLQVSGASDIIGRSLLDLLPREEAEPLLENDRAALAAGGPVRCEERARGRDGHWRVFETVKFPVRDADTGETFGVCAIASDITARKQAERERERLLQELEAAAIDAGRSRAQLEAVFGAIDEGIAVFDPQGNVVMVNPALARITRFAGVEDMKRHFSFFTRIFELRDGDGRRLPVAQWPGPRVMRGEAFSDWELQVLRHDIGHARYVSYSGAPIRDEAGRHVLSVVVHRDITARKTLEQDLQQAHRELELRVLERTAELEAANAALRREQQRTRVVLETATDAYVAADGEGRIVDWNRAAERMFGWSAAEVRGRPVADTLVPMRYRGRHDAGMDRAALAGDGVTGHRVREFTARHRDGHEFPVEMSLSLNRFEGSTVVSAFLRDISARRQGEEELRRAHDELAQSLAAEQAAARAAEAARADAESAMRAAEAANRAKSEFLATMSHEIRTPLNGVIGFNGLLLDGPLTEDKRHYAELARRSGESLLHLLNDFLDFSKIESGHLELEPVDFDPHLEASHALSLVREQAQKKELQLDFHVEAPPRVNGDAARLRQVLLNLLSNAVKFTEYGKVGLRCTGVDRGDDRAWLRFEVSDTGIGIDAAARDRLFQPFSQADASTTRRFGGTGLGLAICKRLATAMGGEVGVNSQLGQGSTFWVELPFARVADGAAAPAVLPEVAGSVPVAQRGRVLVVEDNPVSQLMAAEMLKRLGCRVDVAGNGLEAVEAMRRLPYDLVFMDCDMPIMNGFDATRAIRAEERGKRRVPIVAVTASALKGDSDRCLAVGMDDFMSKPFRLQDMARMVQGWLDKPDGGGGVRC